MTYSLLKNIKQAINPKYQDWVLFQNGSYIIFDTTDINENITEKAIQLIKLIDSVHNLTPLANDGVTKLNKAEGWSVSCSIHGMYTYVNPSEIAITNPENKEIAQLASSKINQDAIDSIVIHTNRKAYDVPLIAGFVGIKKIPLPFVLGVNNFNPKLILKMDYFEHSGIFYGKTDVYENIELVDIFIARMTTNLIISKIDTIFTFVGNTNNTQELKKCLLFLQQKQCVLSEKALSFLEYN
ncbi:hypothetical protein SLW70_11095 [Flavobacterium sp. NG2]|uniref:hypothetical protein n=1 Tax=Flavobacterium sp. NG2 TaxID=3097547 RepID=UPI002A7EB3AD|nr:hypothetical protein [Flavobacterium sp. NG2]WPR70486.1 hypothetical protein SLW70_11095 [Flavobacterium sp. NG2]